jgi:L-alanine-DL-glutamate epimerase-like enolase superfamily enzyme
MSGFSLTPFEFNTPMRVEFGHASATRDKTQTILILAHPNLKPQDAAKVGIGESCPREYVTGETTASVLKFVSAHKSDLESRIDSIADLKNWMSRHKAEIDRNPAAFAAVECALIDFLARRQGVTLEKSLDLPVLQGRFGYSAVLGDSRPWKFWLQAALYRMVGFKDFKVKINGNLDRDRRKLSVFKWFGRAGGIRLRADANNLWSDAPSAIEYIRNLDSPFWAIEEPVTAGKLADQTQIARDLGVRIILDESLLRTDQLEGFSDASELFIANIRISKNGGMLRSIAIAREAIERGLPLIFGAHVGETSVLTRSALSVANCFGDKVVAREGGFGRLLIKRDAVIPSWRFGWGGVLRPGRFLPETYTGSGQTIVPEILQRISVDNEPML